MNRILIPAANKGVVISEIYKYLFPNATISTLKGCTLTVECRVKDGQKVVVLKAIRRLP